MMERRPRCLPNNGRGGVHGVLSILLLMVFWSTNNSASSFVMPMKTTRTPRPTARYDLPTVSSKVNPNDLETPEEREERMKLVRKIQQAFYAGEGEDLVLPSKEDPTILTDVPLWRVQWVELPGYQNVLNVHVAHYTHMFRRILSGSKPWLFGHIYLPGGSENLDNPKYRLQPMAGSGRNTTGATYVGTLMQVSDYKYLDDGRLALIVQAMERFRVLEATQHVPYAIATIQRDPDLESSSSSSTLVPRSTDKKEETPTNWAAVQQSIEWSDWEFRPTVWKEITSSTPESNKDSVGAATPLINYNAGYFPNELINRPGGRVVEQSNAALMEQLRVERVLKKLEYNVWCSLDTMLRLLVELDPGVQVPIPSQLLGLLPLQEDDDDGEAADDDNDCQWPPGFRLEDYAAQLQKHNAVIGTATKSPFLRVSENPSYPLSRRASRLSYAIWIILEAIVIPGGPTKQQILEERSIAKRLVMAQTSLDAVNAILRQSFKR